MKGLIERLHRARLTLASREAGVAEARRRFDEEHKTILQRKAEAALEVQEADAAVREAALARYLKDNNKHPGLGIEIKVRTDAEYEEPKAFAWAQEHRVALKFDKATFDKLAKATPGNFDFVKIHQEPQATIASDLGAVLDGMKE